MYLYIDNFDKWSQNKQSHIAAAIPIIPQYSKQTQTRRNAQLSKPLRGVGIQRPFVHIA